MDSPPISISTESMMVGSCQIWAPVSAQVWEKLL